MRNTWLILKREYLEKIRTKSFLFSTLAMPLIIGLFILPGKLATMKSQQERNIVIVSADNSLAAAIQHSLQSPPAVQRGEGDDDSPRDLAGKYKVQLVTDLSENQRTLLRDRMLRKEIDGYLWIGPQEISSRHVTYGRRETGDFMDQSAVSSAVKEAFTAEALLSRGISPSDAGNLMRDVSLDVVQIDRGQEKKVNTGAAIGATFAMVMLLYSTLLFYGIAVMRSILEEKSSRIVEVLLSSLKPMELMAGKVIGVGAVGLTQVAAWGVMVLAASAPGVIGSDIIRQAQISPAAIIGFIVFFLLGYTLYATMYAALGAMVNTEQEAQQMQIFIMIPLILAISLSWLVIRDPNGPIAVWTSIIPFLSPVLMYIRMTTQAAPIWQIVLSIVLLLGTIYALLVLCARIYRVGILMYGKRPTLPEIIKWVKYAGM